MPHSGVRPPAGVRAPPRNDIPDPQTQSMERERKNDGKRDGKKDGKKDRD
jgi:hypothetical protein